MLYGYQYAILRSFLSIGEIMDIKKALKVSDAVKRLEAVREANTKIFTYKTKNKLKGTELLSILRSEAIREESGACYPIFLRTSLPLEDLLEALSMLEKKLLKEVEKL